MLGVQITRVIAVLGTGLYAGIIAGDRLGAGFARPAADPGAFLQFQPIQRVRSAPLLMPITALAVGAGALRVWLLRDRH